MHNYVNYRFKLAAVRKVRVCFLRAVLSRETRNKDIRIDYAIMSGFGKPGTRANREN